MGRKKYGIGIAAGVVIIGAYFVMTMVMGGEAGQPCDPEWGCRGLDSVCLEGEDGYCSLHCEDQSACPSGWQCGPVTEMTLDGQSAQPEIGTASVCLRP